MIQLVVWKFIRAQLANPIVWLVLASIYGMHWADARGYARHEREAVAAIAKTNVVLASTTAQQTVDIQIADSDRTKTGTEAQRIAVEASATGPPPTQAIGRTDSELTRVAGLALPQVKGKPAPPVIPVPVNCPALIPAGALAKLNAIN